MSNRIIIGYDEYQEMTEALKSAEEALFAQIDVQIKNLESLACKDGGFKAEQISVKVAMIISELNRIKDRLQNSYDMTGNVIKSFARSVDDIDIGC